MDIPEGTLPRYNLEFGASKKQALALQYLMDDVTSEIGYGGAAGGGKSYLGVAWLWMMCHKYPGTRWFMCRKELQNLKKTTLNSYYKFCQDYKVPEALCGKLNSKDNIVKFLNGSEILLLDGAHNPSDPLYTRFGSLELTGGFVDESNEIDGQAITILSTRIGRQRNQEYKIKPKILETFNPDKGHVYTRYYKPWKENGMNDKFQTMNKSGVMTDKVFLQALVTDNAKVDPNYIEQLKKSDTITRERLLFGNFDYDDTKGRLFRYDEVIDLFRNNVEKSDIFYLSCDVARLGEDKTVIVVWRGMEALAFYKYEGKTTDEVAEEIKKFEELYNIRRHHIVVDSDGVGGGVVDQLRGCYQFVNNATPFKTELERASDLYNKNYGNLKAQCYFKLKECMERRTIKVNADGQLKGQISLELDNILIKTSASDAKTYLESKEDMKKRMNGQSPDHSDALMMRMIWLVKEENSDVKEEDLGVFEIDYSDVLGI